MALAWLWVIHPERDRETEDWKGTGPSKAVHGPTAWIRDGPSRKEELQMRWSSVAVMGWDSLKDALALWAPAPRRL